MSNDPNWIAEFLAWNDAPFTECVSCVNYHATQAGQCCRRSDESLRETKRNCPNHTERD